MILNNDSQKAGSNVSNPARAMMGGGNIERAKSQRRKH
jgi:hypothetical protein